jgi:hypothetical protein
VRRGTGGSGHAVASLAYAGVAVAVTVVFGAAVMDLRQARVARYDGAAALGAFRKASDECLGAGAILAAVALLPLVVAIATPWDRYAAWAGADDDRVELMLITRAGSAAPAMTRAGVGPPGRPRS